jgi:hypothetical protein
MRIPSDQDTDGQMARGPIRGQNDPRLPFCVNNRMPCSTSPHNHGAAHNDWGILECASWSRLRRRRSMPRMSRIAVQRLQKNWHGQISFHPRSRQMPGIYQACDAVQQETEPHLHGRCDRWNDVSRRIEAGHEQEARILRETRNRFHGGFGRRGAKLPGHQRRCSVPLANLLLFRNSRLGSIAWLRSWAIPRLHPARGKPLRFLPLRTSATHCWHAKPVSEPALPFLARGL